MKRMVLAAMAFLLIAVSANGAAAPKPRGVKIPAIATDHRVYVGVVGLQSRTSYPCRILTLECSTALTIQIDPATDAVGYMSGSASVARVYGASAGDIDYYADRSIEIPADKKVIIEGRITEFTITDGSAGGVLYVWAEYED